MRIVENVGSEFITCQGLGASEVPVRPTVDDLRGGEAVKYRACL